MLGSAVLACVTVVFVGNPVRLVTAVALISLCLAPVLYGLNLVSVSRHIADPTLKPSRFTLALGWAGCLLMILTLALTVYVKLLA